jgi:hypothetical protein
MEAIYSTEEKKGQKKYELPVLTPDGWIVSPSENLQSVLLTAGNWVQQRYGMVGFLRHPDPLMVCGCPRADITDFENCRNV